MGLFSSKYETKVGTTVSRVVEDNALPDSVLHGTIKGIVDDDDQLIENILEELISGVGVKADRMFNYGKNKYGYGLPMSSVRSSTSGQDDIAALIAQTVGQSVTLDYYHFGALNNLHTGWYKLTHEYGYNAKTNVLGDLTTAKGKPVKLTNMAVVVTEATLLELANGSLDQWGEPASANAAATGNGLLDGVLKKVNAAKKPTLFELDAAAPNDYLRVEYTWDDVGTAVVEGVTVPRTVTMKDSFHIQLTGLNQNAEWHQAKYTRADGEIGYFSYEAGTGLYPAVDALHDPAWRGNGQYFPWGYFRFNATSGTEDKSSTWFKQSKKLMDYVGIDYETVCDAIHENPDIKQVEQAMLMMAVPAVTKEQMEMRYLFDYFGRMTETEDGAKPEYVSGGPLTEKILTTLATSMPAHSVVIQDSRFKMALGFNTISKSIVQGSIGKVGSYNSGYGTTVDSVTGKNTVGGTPVTWNTMQKVHYYQKQTTETQYEEIRVTNLKMVYYIYGEYTATADEDDDILLIPLDRSITVQYSMPDRELIYARSLHYVFNSRVVTKVKWYQQGWFRAVLIVAAIIITIVSYGQGWQTLAAAVSAGTVTMGALMYTIAIAVYKYVLISLAVKLFVKVAGVKLAFIVAVVAAIAGSYQAIQAGGLQGAPFASELLQIGNGLSQGITSQIQDDFGELKKEADDFQLFVKEEQKKLDEANKLLENSNWLTPTIIFGEKPHDYYQRTVHSGNIGVLSLDAISAFVDVRLQLPKLTDTLQGNNYDDYS